MLNSKTQQKSRNPSFSSSLLDEIYNSIDPKPIKTQSFLTKKQSSNNITKDRFFTSLSSSSDSNSSIFSSSDTELTLNHPKKLSSRPLCFGPSKPKPRKTEEKSQNRNFRVYDDFDYLSEHQIDEQSRNRRSKKSFGNLKTPKTPASPAARIVNFLNSLFTNSKQSMAVKRTNFNDDSVSVGKLNEYPSGCSSASSFSRSCLNKNSVVKSADRVKRTVRFSPANVDVSEKSNRRSGESEGFVNGGLRLKKSEDGGRRSVEEIAREFLRDYHKNHEKDKVKKSYRDSLVNYEEEEEEEDEGSDSSSDLFELDLDGNHFNGYGDELPVYETTFAGLIL